MEVRAFHSIHGLDLVALQVRMYSRALAIIGGFLILASGAGEVYRQKPRSRSLQSTGQVFLGVYLICMVSCGSYCSLNEPLE